MDFEEYIQIRADIKEMRDGHSLEHPNGLIIEGLLGMVIDVDVNQFGHDMSTV
jgi:hypothetical protein